MHVTCISVVNRSNLLSDNACCLIAQACHVQLRDHVCPAWGRVPVDVAFVPRNTSIVPGTLPVYVTDDPDVAGTLGYHTEDRIGRPVGQAFVRPILLHGGGVMAGDLSVAVIVSHEVIESLIDPSCQLWSERGDGVLVAHEACDPVHGQSYGIEVGGSTTSVSNFVMPAWFDSDVPSLGTRYDWLGTLSGPFMLGPMGYVGTLTRGRVAEDTTVAALSSAIRPRLRSAIRAARHPL